MSDTEALAYGPTPVELAELKTKHPELSIVGHPKLKQAVALIPVDRGSFKRFRAQATEPMKRAAATENLVKSCVVWPDKAGLDAQLERYPALVEVWGNELLEMAGIIDSADLEKKAP